jgi:hypothetical protein
MNSELVRLCGKGVIELCEENPQGITMRKIGFTDDNWTGCVKNMMQGV